MGSRTQVKLLIVTMKMDYRAELRQGLSKKVKKGKWDVVRLLKE